MAEKLIHEILPVGLLQCNCSVVGDPETRDAIVIDPGDEVDRILEVITRHKLNVRAILNTHAHIDHVGGLQKMQRATGAPVLMHPDDLELYGRLDFQAAWLGIVAKVYPTASAREETEALAQLIASRAPLSVQWVKQVINRGMDVPLAEALQLEGESAGHTFATEDRNEGMRAFLERRPPKFEGK